jgi:phosphatidylglycerophosphatase C
MDGSGDAPLVVAAFDVDGTLTTRDCVVPYLSRLAGRGRVAAAGLRHPLLLAATAVGRGDRDRVKELVVGRIVRGRPVAALDDLGRRFAAHVTAAWLRVDTLARLRWHRERGHRVVLVSASLRPYLEPLAATGLGGVDAVLCTDVEADDAGICTGLLAGRNCRGPEKAQRLRQWLGDRPATIWAYGDSAGDAELLAMADHPVRVDRRPITATPSEVAA